MRFCPTLSIEQPLFQGRGPLTRRTLRRGLVALLLGALGLLAAAAPYRPVITAGAPVATPATPTPLPATRSRLHVFNTGFNRMSSLLVGDQRPWRPAPAFVIEHPVQGLVAFDTGLSPAVAREGEAALPIPMRWLFESRGAPERTLDAQMRPLGLEPESVRWVVLSHLHEDHTGALGAFPNARVVAGVERAGWERAAFRPGGPAPFDEHADLFGDGSVILLRGGGHATEDVLALVALEGGWALLTGDAVVHRDWLASDDVQRVAVDRERAATVRNQVRAALRGDPTLRLLPGHDLGGVSCDRPDLSCHRPAWFEPGAWPLGPRR